MGAILGAYCALPGSRLSLAMGLVDKIALALCGYGLPGEPCEAPCEFCLGQADEVLKILRGEYENWLNKENGVASG